MRFAATNPDLVNAPSFSAGYRFGTPDIQRGLLPSSHPSYDTKYAAREGTGAETYGVSVPASIMARDTVLPKLAETLQAMEKPKSEGGILEEGQDKVAFVVVQVNGELMISICPLAKTENKMEMCKPVNTQPLEQMLKQNQLQQ